MSLLHYKRKPGAVLFDALNVFLFVVLTFLCVYPFYYLIINSISANDLSAAGEVYIIPLQVHLTNYRDILRLDGLYQALLVSVARTVLAPPAPCWPRPSWASCSPSRTFGSASCGTASW